MLKPLRIYHSLPGFARGCAASLRGVQLRYWRYGRETEGLMLEAVQRETWEESQWNEWRHAKLSHLLKKASTSSPYYIDLWRRLNAKEPLRSSQVLADWPILTKDQLRVNPRSFLLTGHPVAKMNSEQTSGTTGAPLTLWHGRSTSRQWYALMEARWRGWAGVSRHDRWAIFGGQLVTPIEQIRPPFWVWNAGLRQLYLSSYHISPVNCASYIQALRDHRVTYLWGYSSSLYSIALLAKEQRIPMPALKVVISNAEPLLEHQRALMASVFNCPVRDTYGMAEMTCAASECEAGNLHLWQEAGIFEVLKDDSDLPVKEGETGRLIATGLINEEMPLIRYETGDRVAIAPAGSRCACGRTLPVLSRLEGRSDDLIQTSDGRRIGRLDPIFKAGFPIREAQIIQESVSSLRVLIVPDPSYTEKTSQLIISAVRQHVGETSVAVECVKSIPRGANGKFRAVISHVSTSKNEAGSMPIAPSGRPERHEATALRLYHALPPVARGWAVSLHGLLLRRKRYGKATRHMAEEALLRDTWSPEEWTRWQAVQLRRQLELARMNVPHYKKLWEERVRTLGPADPGDLRNWPVLSKETLRHNEESFLSDQSVRKGMEQLTTSGTTGTPVRLWRSRETNQAWYALYEARIRLWNGFDRHSRWGHMGGQPVVPFHQSKPPYWVWNSSLKQLYLSCMHVSPSSGDDYLSAIEKYKLDYLLGYSSSIALLAEHALERNRRVALKLVLTDSEALLPHQRKAIEAAFLCPVRETYGMAEIACAASECSAGNLHIWPEAGTIELLDDNNEPVAPGQTGRIVATGLLNPDMPLIRYDTKDLAQADPDPSPCSCGRTLPRLKKLLGRDDDVVVTKDGRRVVQIDRIFEPDYDLREAQIVQDSIGRFRIRIVPGPLWTAHHAQRLCADLRNLVGEAEVVVETVPMIERTWAGKFRIIVSNVKTPSINQKSV